MRRLGLGIAVVIAAAVLASPAPSGATGGHFTETFDSTTWYQQWGLTSAPWHTAIAGSNGESYLRISFPLVDTLPDHPDLDGTSFMFSTGSSDDVTFRYRIRFEPTWRPAPQQSGKLPGFGLPELAPGGDCLQACGEMPVTGPYYSARGSFNTLNTGGTYVYTPACGGQKAQTGIETTWSAGARFLVNTWYTVEQHIHMNTPGVADGRVQAWVDGAPVYDSGPAFCFRTETNANVHVGNVWMDFYYGGKTPPPAPMWIDVDDVDIAY